MKTNVTKRIVTLVLAFVMVFTTVCIGTTEVEAAEQDWTIVYASSDVESASSGSEVKLQFSVTNNSGVQVLILTSARVGMKLSLYDSTGSLVNAENNPLTVNASNLEPYESGYVYCDIWKTGIPSGDYYYGITFDSNVYYNIVIGQKKTGAKINQTQAIVTKGFTKKLAVTGAKVKAWKTKNAKIAKVDKNGKVTGVKAGKTTVYAVTEDGQNLICKVTVKENKYSATKVTGSDVDSGKCVMEVYKASFDKSGNLVMTARIVNNTTDYITALRNVKITVKDASGKVIGTYKTGRYNITVSAYSAKDVKFTLKKSSLKKKNFDLRNVVITRNSGSYYYR